MVAVAVEIARRGVGAVARVGREVRHGHIKGQAHMDRSARIEQELPAFGEFPPFGGANVFVPPHVAGGIAKEVVEVTVGIPVEGLGETVVVAEEEFMRDDRSVRGDEIPFFELGRVSISNILQKPRCTASAEDKVDVAVVVPVNGWRGESGHDAGHPGEGQRRLGLELGARGSAGVHQKPHYVVYAHDDIQIAVGIPIDHAGIGEVVDVFVERKGATDQLGGRARAHVLVIEERWPTGLSRLMHAVVHGAAEQIEVAVAIEIRRAGRRLPQHLDGTVICFQRASGLKCRYSRRVVHVLEIKHDPGNIAAHEQVHVAIAVPIDHFRYRDIILREKRRFRTRLGRRDDGCAVSQYRCCRCQL